MALYVATATVALNLTVEFEMENASEQEINAMAIELINTEANEVLGGADFIDDDISPINVERLDTGDFDAIDC